MKIISWNVAGLRAKLKKENFHNFIKNTDANIICLQETKAEENQIKLTQFICEKFPFRFWNSSDGTTQKKGFSGTSIWSSIKPIHTKPTPGFDNEGRTVTLEFDDFILICVYTPNSQSMTSERFKFRIENWDKNFREYINEQNKIKSTIVCGDLNVINLEIDMYNPKKYKNKVAGFFDLERESFNKYLDDGFVDVFRNIYPNEENKYTYWNQIVKTCREKNMGWRLDYFLACNKLLPKINDCNIITNQLGSDHCPIYLILD